MFCYHGLLVVTTVHFRKGYFHVILYILILRENY